MELRLAASEVELLRDRLEADLSALLMEIARTDNRAMREGLRKQAEMLRAILDRLAGGERMAS